MDKRWTSIYLDYRWFRLATTKRPLRDTFDNTDYIINLDMIQKGILEELLELK